MEKKDEPVLRSEVPLHSLLKIRKIPSGTAGQKKVVRFADDMGLNLTHVRTFTNEIKKIPTFIYRPKLPISSRQRPNQLSSSSRQGSDKVIMPLFKQPSNFMNIVETKNVALEYVAVANPDSFHSRFLIMGIVRVRNLDFDKSVYIRYSLDGWRSYTEVRAEYMPYSSDGYSDKFTFTIFRNSMEIGQRIEMAIRFSCKGEEFWDNNDGENYCFRCMKLISKRQ